MRRLPPRSVALAEDETDLLLFPPLRAGWAPRGEAKEVALSGRNARRVVFGSLNLRTGTRLLVVRERQRAGDFQAFLEQLHWHYRGWHVALLLDEDPSHTAAGSRRMAERSGTELVWLPKRAPELNPMDHLWGHGKDEVSSNKQYESIDDHVDRFVGYLRDLSSREALSKAGVLSADFWLKSVL
jgi:transposase